MKHLLKQHGSTKLVAKDLSPTDAEGATPCKQPKLDFTRTAVQPISQAELNKLIARYVVDDMHPLSTVESVAFRQLTSKIPVTNGGSGQMCRKTFSSYLDREYGLPHVSTTADIWTVYNKSFLGVTAHWIDLNNMLLGKSALAFQRFKGQHTYDIIATEIDNIHSSYGLSSKVTATVTDNGSNFVKAFQMYQPPESDTEDRSEEDEATFTNIGEVLDSAVNVNDVVLPPHHRCASHTLNLISCTDVDKWLMSKAETKSIYRNAITKYAGLWNKASRSTVASEIVNYIIAKKLLVPCTTRWNSFYDAVARIEREHQPLTVALDILQGEDNCFYGTLLPTLETLMSKTLELKKHLAILDGLPEAIVQVRAAILFCIYIYPVNSSVAFEDAYVSVENEVADYFKSGATGMDTLNQFPTIKRVSLKYNAATLSSAPVERLFSLGNLILSPKRNRLSDQKFEKLLLLRYNHWFES
uniref:HAT C-terminal dimerisation domain-containing protein n=1 Tax=Sparus aurata TaxID=8175 RepID=A0A671U1X3_SPAAU